MLGHAPRSPCCTRSVGLLEGDGLRAGCWVQDWKSWAGTLFCLLSSKKARRFPTLPVEHFDDSFLFIQLVVWTQRLGVVLKTNLALQSKFALHCLIARSALNYVTQRRYRSRAVEYIKVHFGAYVDGVFCPPFYDTQ